MKDLDYYMNLPYKVEYETEESDDTWIAFIPVLGRGTCYAIGYTKTQALQELTEIKKGLFELLLSEGEKIPEPATLYTIKPLVWSSSANFWKTNTLLVSYWIDRTDYGGFELVCMGNRGKEYSHIYQSLDEAKQKAEQDWQERLSRYLTEYKEGK